MGGSNVVCAKSSFFGFFCDFLKGGVKITFSKVRGLGWGVVRGGGGGQKKNFFFLVDFGPQTIIFRHRNMLGGVIVEKKKKIL